MTPDAGAARPSPARRRTVPALLAVAVAVNPAPAAGAQFGAVVSIFSDDRFRGISISDERPVGTLDLSFDASNGLYASLSGTLVATQDEGVKPLSAAFSGGFAKALRTGLSADFGLFHASYSEYSGLPAHRALTEAYVGLTGSNFGTRFSVSPNYFGVAHWTLHVGANAHADLSPYSRLEADVGVLFPLSRNSHGGRLPAQLDARFGISQRAGPVTLHAALSGGGNAIYRRRGRRVGLVLGLSSAL